MGTYVDIDDIYGLLSGKEQVSFIGDAKMQIICEHVARYCDIDTVLAAFTKAEIEKWLYYNAEDYGYVKEETNLK